MNENSSNEIRWSVEKYSMNFQLIKESMKRLIATKKGAVDARKNIICFGKCSSCGFNSTHCMSIHFCWFSNSKNSQINYEWIQMVCMHALHFKSHVDWCATVYQVDTMPINAYKNKP